MRQECAKWLADVEAELPSAIFRVRDRSGALIAGASIAVDGGPLRAPSEAAAPLDPGEHFVRVEARGFVGRTETIVLRSGERDRSIDLTLTPEAPPIAAPSPPPRAVASVRPAWPGWAMGVLGVVGLASFGYFGLSGVSRYDELKTTCAPRCPRDRTTAVERRFLVADVSLGVSALALAGATYWFLTQPAGDASVGVRVGVSREGARAVVEVPLW